MARDGRERERERERVSEKGKEKKNDPPLMRENRN